MPAKPEPWSRLQPRSLQSRQLLAASLGLIAFLALAGYALDRAFLNTAENALRERLRDYALSFAGDTEFDVGGDLVPPYEMPDSRLNRPGSGLYAQIVLPYVVWESKSAKGPELPDVRLLSAKQQVFEGPLPLQAANGEHRQVYRYGYGLAWSGDALSDEIPYTVYVLEDTSRLEAQLEVFRRALWGYLGGAAAVLLLLQMVVLRWSLHPLRRVIDELKRVQRGMGTRMSERHPRELEPLTESINALIESERENLDRQRNILADLAHSLKTPLAVLRTRLDSGADDSELRQELSEQLKRMNDLVGYQLSRAASGGHKLFAAPLAIEPSAEEIVRGLEKVYATKQVLCEFEIASDARFYGEKGDLQELLGNLLENAFKWAHSRVLLTVATGASAPNRRPGLRLMVEDDGPGIPADKIAYVLQRGVRGDERVQGHGIGLAIVQDIVRSYRGELHVGDSEELSGACFEVVLPPGL
ncbi:MAG: two-component sensor histidine kinase [Lysobacteraceae bacterium]|nr:MAG: two-component sensor histidine kinase [Xanthomonadaceae bacterium]